jgi:hypothetical protein
MWGVSARRRQDHAPAGISRPALAGLDRARWARLALALRCRGRVIPLKEQTTPAIGSGGHLSAPGGGWGIEQRSARISPLRFSSGYLMRVNRKKGGGY